MVVALNRKRGEVRAAFLSVSSLSLSLIVRIDFRGTYTVSRRKLGPLVRHTASYRHCRRRRHSLNFFSVSLFISLYIYTVATIDIFCMFADRGVLS